MFTGIIETIGRVKTLTKERENLHIEIESVLAPQLKVDQSVSHNGICLTVTAISDHSYTVTAIKETLEKTNLKHLKEEDPINLERAMQLGDRLDGHIVQGHVDCTAICIAKEDQDGSILFKFQYKHQEFKTVDKGSITVNGVSLTVIDAKEDGFGVAIIPYTLEHTNFRQIEVGTEVNLEFDIIGKYVANLMKPYLR